MFRLLFVLLLLLCAIATPLEADDFFDEFTPGLLGEYYDGTRTFSRVDRELSFDWNGSPALEGLDPETLTVTWRGQMLVKEDTLTQVHLYGRGKVTVAIDGLPMLRVTQDEVGWVHGESIELPFGFLPIEIRYEAVDGPAVMKLFWSSQAFELEPIPYHRLFHQVDSRRAQLVEQGRVLFDDYRCNRCHVGATASASPPGPSLTTLMEGLDPDWLVKKLRHEHPEVETSRMPTFDFSEDDARAIAAWLAKASKPVKLDTARPVKRKGKQVPPDGRAVVHSVGCLACHRIGELGTHGPHGGGDLSTIGQKRSADWLYTWLTEPARVNPDHRMPHFQLTSDERHQSALWLSTLGKSEESKRGSIEQTDDLVARGAELVKAARCANCHRVDGLEPVTGLTSLSDPVEDWSRSCLAESADWETLRPAYPQAEREALRAYVEERVIGRASGVSELAESDLGALVLERRNCLACHERNGAAGLVETAGRVANVIESLRGQSQGLIPPNLTAVGDKLRDKAIAEAVQGGVKPRRMPWLKVQMPRFDHDEESLRALTAHLITRDRIPADSDATEDSPGESEASAEVLLAGRQLVGVGGFSCIACHQVGEYQPRNVALGTRGSDLKGIGDRVREEFFVRWTRSPLRIIPGMEMPSYEKPALNILDEDVRAQLAAVWDALNDPRFEAPTNPSQVEQLITVTPPGPPAIARDVFTVSKENGGGYVARAFAVGFSNGHSLLFDVDRLAVRDWTYGDFARQRTEGKSWYWDLAGAPLVSGLTGKSELVLQRGEQWFPLVREDEPTVRLEQYRIDGEGNSVTLTYSVPVPGATKREVQIHETWRMPASSQDGHAARVARSIRVASGLESGEQLWVLPAETTSRLLEARITVGDSTFETVPGGRGVRLPCTIDYAAESAPPPQPGPERPVVPYESAPVTTVPGMTGVRLPLERSIMPTALDCFAPGKLVFTSLKGHVFLVRDDDGDGTPETLQVLEEGLAAPFGVLVQRDADSGRTTTSVGSTDDGGERVPPVLVTHKPELMRLESHVPGSKGFGREIVADGWGYTDDYHDWTAGPVIDERGWMYLAISSNYSQTGRPKEVSRWRGMIVRLRPEEAGGKERWDIEPIAYELRYPMGIAFDPLGRLFVSDQQGVANTFNEINHIQKGRRYGVKALHDPDRQTPETPAAIKIPHPWTRSVNGIFFIPVPESPQEGEPEGFASARQRAGAPTLPDGHLLTPFAGHGIGCEYNERFLIRFSFQEVEGELQGATYLFSRSEWEKDSDAFVGPICGAIAANGDVYIGSIHDSGWLGGLNTGEIVRLTPTGKLPNGIRELRATPRGFEIEFLEPVDPDAAREPGAYSLTGYTRVWKGSYSTEDSGQYRPRIGKITVSPDGRTVTLDVDRLETDYVYEVSVSLKSGDGSELFPNIGHYTMNRIPK